MTADEYREAIKSLGLSQVAAGRLVGATDRASRRWAGGGEIPGSVAILLVLLLKKKITVADIVAAGGVAPAPPRVKAAPKVKAAPRAKKELAS